MFGRSSKPVQTSRPRTPPKPPDAQEWDGAQVLTPAPSTREPPLVSEGAGLPFAPARLRERANGLDPADPAVAALVAQLRRSHRKSRNGHAGEPAEQLLTGWRELARTEDEVLFGGGLPPQMVTVVIRRQGRRGRWSVLTIDRSQQLRAAHDGMRASSFRLDPTYEVVPGDTELHLLVIEQTHATGMLAHGRFATPELFVGETEIVLRMFIRPIGGFQNRAVKGHETPVIVSLPGPVGSREIVDGAVFAQAG